MRKGQSPLRRKGICPRRGHTAALTPSARIRRAQYAHACHSHRWRRRREETQPAPALQGDAQPAAVPAHGLADQPRAHPGQPRPAPDPCAAAGGDAVRRQADHRQRPAPEPARCRLPTAGRGAGQRHAQPTAGPAGTGIRPGHRLGPARPPGQLCRCPAVGTVRQRHQHPADGTCGDIGPGGLRGPGPAGQTGPRAAPDHGPDEPDEPAVRPGAGCDHRGQPGHRPAGLRAVADPAARAGTA
ncbi:hypothetical protein G6F22_016030 [Rhizopus arrhizus]|nr:hypothetical protein G6F22_016030 [Rhizopus arrhizus]